MIVWRSGSDIVNIEAVESHYCEVCGTERPFHLVLQYKYWGLYWIFSFITKRQYLVVCEICNRGWELESKQIDRDMGKSSIPFMRRYGLVCLIIGIVVLAIIGLL